MNEYRHLQDIGYPMRVIAEENVKMVTLGFISSNLL